MMPSLEAVMTYRPQGLAPIPVISLRCILRDCSTILSKTELKTLRYPSSVPARMAGMFHWLVSHANLLTRNPPTANNFCTWSFYILN